MSWLNAILLGIVQGLTEFLPVSRSGHLVLARNLLGVTPPSEEAKVLWEVVLHVGTLVAILVVLRRDVWQVIVGFVRGLAASRRGLASALRQEEGFALALWILLGSIPAGVVGVTFRDFFERLFESPFLAAGALLVTGTFLFSTRYAHGPRDKDQVSWLDAIIIGFAQAVAIVPGISRSGATISAGLFRGVDRAQAARFSFLLAIPAIAGAAALECRHLAALSFKEVMPLLVGGIVSAIVGLFALIFLLRIVRAGRLHSFAYYCWAAGVIALVWLLAGA